MRFKIHNDILGDYFIVEGETVEECRVKAMNGEILRNWTDCWSEVV